MADKTGAAVGGAAKGAAAGAAVGGPWGAVIGGAIGLTAGLMSNDDAGAGEAHNQMVIAQNMLAEIKKAPDISKPLILEKYKQAGLLTPEMEQAVKTGPSAVAQIGTDSQSLDAQRQALQQMQQRAQGGLSASDRATLAQTNLQTQADTEAKRQQILQQAQAQMGGAGQTGRTLAAQLLAAQGGANQQAANSNQIAQMSSQNALQAASMSGQLGGQINQQQFGQAAQKAQAADEMNRFNIQNQIAQQQRNVAAGNQAQAGNLANAQGISNQNVSQQNAELNNQLNRQMQQWEADKGLVTQQAASHSGAVQPTLQMGQMGAQSKQNMIGGAAQLGQGLYNAYSSSGGAGGESNSGGLGSMFSGSGSESGTGTEAGGSYSDVAAGAGGSMVGYNGGKVQNFKIGGQVPGQAKVSGDHPVNDTVHARLSPGEIVVPRSLAESKIGKELLKLINAHNSVKNKLNGND